MNLLDDIKNVSDTVLEKLAAQFTDLPKPLLAAIGAGDLAVERLGALREELSEKFGDTFGDGLPSGDDVKDFASDLPGKAQKIATDIAHHLQEFASEAPEKAQQLIADLPAKAQEFANSLSPDKLKATVDGYTQMVSTIFANLAERGGETVAKARADEKTVDADDEPAAQKAPAKPAAKPAAKKAPAKPAAKPAAKKAPAKPAAKPAAKKAPAKPAAKPAAKKAPAKPAATTKVTEPTADTKLPVTPATDAAADTTK